jgi:hypothetical protein
MKLQAATRLQLNAAKGDAKAFREALLKAGVRISNADAQVYKGEYKAAKQEMAAALKEIEAGFAAAMTGKVEFEKESYLGFNRAHEQSAGEVTWYTTGSYAAFEFEFTPGDALGFVTLVFGRFNTTYEFRASKFNQAKYKSFVNKAIDTFEAKGLA